METGKRMLAKSITWQVCGFIVMTLVGFAFTGSFSAGSGIAMTGTIIGFASYFLHEYTWRGVGWGRV